MIDAMIDALSDILEMVGIEAALYFQSEFCAPWGMAVHDTGFAQFHFIVSGEAVVRQAESDILMSSGDLILFPKGAAHELSDAIGSPTLPGQQVVKAITSGQSVFEGEGRRTRIICGHFAYDLKHRHPMIEELPDILFLCARDTLGIDPIRTLLQIIIQESLARMPGHKAIVQRLAEAVFAAILRGHDNRTGGMSRFLAGLKDPRMARCINHIHSCFPVTPGLGELAKTVGMSRSALALAFKSSFGYGPGNYAIRLKLLKAAKQLRRSDESIENIALANGYSAPASFARAFRTMYQRTPRQYRNREAV